MKKILVLLLVIAMFASSCAAHRHTIGKGPQSGVQADSRQWYALWGLVRIGSVDTLKLAGDKTDYEIYTRVNGIDWLINFFLGWTTIQTRTVTVIK